MKAKRRQPAKSKKIDSGATARQLQSLRKKIRKIDSELFDLVAHRLQIARQIGDIKLRAALPLRDYRVEQEVVRANQERSKALGISEDLSDEFTRMLIRHSVIAQGIQRDAQRRLGRIQGAEILIIGGLGQMGRWLGQYFDAMGHRVTIYDPGPDTPAVGSASTSRRRSSQRRKASPPHPPAFATFHQTLEAACQTADFIVIATPISSTAPTYDLLTQIKPKGIIFDICSLKTPVKEAFSQAERQGLRVASIHPMFGPGVRLLAGRNIVICRGKSSQAARQVASLFADTSARLVYTTLDAHDKLMSFVLGMSHLTNLIFANALADSGLDYPALEGVASTTFQRQLRVTRPVVQENPRLYYEIQAENAFTPRVIEGLQNALNLFSRSVSSRDFATFERAMLRARRFLARAGQNNPEEDV